jgi:hypothetical protein
MIMRLNSWFRAQSERLFKLLIAGSVLGALCGCAAGTTPTIAGSGTQNGVSASTTVTAVKF